MIHVVLEEADASKVNDPDMGHVRTCLYQDVLRLDVSVQDAFGVDVTDCSDHLLQNQLKERERVISLGGKNTPMHRNPKITAHLQLHLLFT